MSEKPTKLVINCTTNETTIVELTAEEVAQREVDAAAYAIEAAAREEAEEAKANAKLSAQAKLAALGLSAEEIAALG